MVNGRQRPNLSEIHLQIEGRREKMKLFKCPLKVLFTIPTIGHGDSNASFEDCALEKLYFEVKAVGKVFY